ncbi:hypothetical protein H9P43_006383 [Blastocladiella emersonii ATCC 22665]|nr:hypothetical protein H9P43_006383 [Blastocladiella emersonii ATCC 22665]
MTDLMQPNPLPATTTRAPPKRPPRFIARVCRIDDPDRPITHTSLNGLHGGKVYADLCTYDTDFLRDLADFYRKAAILAAGRSGTPSSSSDAAALDAAAAGESIDPGLAYDIVDLCERIDTRDPHAKFHFHIDIDFNDEHLRPHPAELRRLVRNAVWSALPPNAPRDALRAQSVAAMKRGDRDNQHINFFGLVVNAAAARFIHARILHSLRTRYGDIEASAPCANDQRDWSRIVDSGYNGLRMLGSQKRRVAGTKLQQDLSNVYCAIDERPGKNDARRFPPTHRDLVRSSIMYLPRLQYNGSTHELYRGAVFYEFIINPVPDYVVLDAAGIEFATPSAAPVELGPELTFKGGVDSVMCGAEDTIKFLAQHTRFLHPLSAAAVLSQGQPAQPGRALPPAPVQQQQQPVQQSFPQQQRYRQDMSGLASPSSVFAVSDAWEDEIKRSTSAAAVHRIDSGVGSLNQLAAAAPRTVSPSFLSHGDTLAPWLHLAAEHGLPVVIAHQSYVASTSHWFPPTLDPARLTVLVASAGTPLTTKPTVACRHTATGLRASSPELAAALDGHAVVWRRSHQHRAASPSASLARLLRVLPVAGVWLDDPVHHAKHGQPIAVLQPPRTGAQSLAEIARVYAAGHVPEQAVDDAFLYVTRAVLALAEALAAFAVPPEAIGIESVMVYPDGRLDIDHCACPTLTSLDSPSAAADHAERLVVRAVHTAASFIATVLGGPTALFDKLARADAVPQPGLDAAFTVQLMVESMFPSAKSHHVALLCELVHALGGAQGRARIAQWAATAAADEDSEAIAAVLSDGGAAMPPLETLRQPFVTATLAAAAVAG